MKPLLDALLASDKEDIEKLYGYLYLGEYWSLQNELVQAEAALKELKELLKNSKTIPKGYSLIANMAATELNDEKIQ